jgi:hypothetical protein
MTDFDDLIDSDDLSPDEELRLRRVHELLLQAGPPADLPPALERAPEGDRHAGAEIIDFPLPRRRWAVAAVAALAAVVLAFGGGYVFGHSKAQDAFAASRVVPMHGSKGALALLRIAKADDVGNWPMQIEVTGLPAQAKRGSYYTLWLTKGHKPAEACGTFRVHGSTTTARFTIPYSLKGVDGWVVTAQTGADTSAGPVVLST